MILTVLQPSYFPSIEFCARAQTADVVVWANTFLFKKGSVINRTRIKTVDGGRWLTIPVLTKGRGPQKISDIHIDNHNDWRGNHWRNIKNNYQNSPYYYYYNDELKNIFGGERQTLEGLIYPSAHFLFKSLGFKKEIVRSCTLPKEKDRTDRILAWLQATHCDTFLIPAYELFLIDIQRVKDAGFYLEIFYSSTVKYHQQFSGFVPSLSALDLLFNEGEQSLSILIKGILERKRNG